MAVAVCGEGGLALSCSSRGLSRGLGDVRVHRPRGTWPVWCWLCEHPANSRLVGAAMHSRHQLGPRLPEVLTVGDPTASPDADPAQPALWPGTLRASTGHRWEDQAEHRFGSQQCLHTPRGLQSEGPADRPPVRIPGSQARGARLTLAPWQPRCLLEEEGPPHPRGSHCLHLCFLPDSDCLALGSLLSTVCLAQPP